jgi:hypothetical protein
VVGGHGERIMVRREPVELWATRPIFGSWGPTRT